MKHIRVCELCGAEIPEEWDTDEHLGTCPSCKRLAKFVYADELRKKLEESEIEHDNDDIKNEQDKILLDTYEVITISDTGRSHVNYVNLAKLIMEETAYKFITIEDIGTGKQEIYYYNSGYYHPGGENRVRELVQYYLDDLSSIHRKNEVVDYVKDTSHMLRRDLEPPVNLVNVKNGIFDLETNRLIPHSPDYYFLNQIPINYNPEAKCPNIIKFFNEVIYPEYVPAMQEMFGFCLYRKYLLHKAFMLHGGGRNGKGTTILLLEKFLGAGNFSTRGLHELIDDKFAKESLYGKLANLGAELSYRAIRETDVFKNLTGGEPITGEKKFHGAFSFKNYAKLIFNTNQVIMPKYDKTKAYFDRWIIFNFPETFDGDNEKTNPDILNDLTTHEELEGLLVWAIDGLKRLLEFGRFTYHVDEEATGEWYEMLLKPELQFMNEYLVEVQGSEIIKEEVYDTYKKWATLRRYAVLSKGAFTRKLKENFKNIDLKDTRRGGERTKVIYNLNWNDEKIGKIDSNILESTNQSSLMSSDEKRERCEKQYEESHIIWGEDEEK